MSERAPSQSQSPIGDHVADLRDFPVQSQEQRAILHTVKVQSTSAIQTEARHQGTIEGKHCTLAVVGSCAYV
jgi:hypothetical protein